jgi:nucleoside-diphosphate-sugar epimerase
MNILVTGHNGFIGRNLTHELTCKGNQVSAVFQPERGDKAPAEIQMIELDKNNPLEFAKKLEEYEIDGIIHLATRFLVNHHISQVADLIDSNIRYAALLLDAANLAGVKWFINTASYWQHYQNKDYSPVNLYAAIKQGFETIAQYYIETGTTRFATLNLFDTYGPGDTRPKLLNHWNKIAQSGEPMKMSGGGQLLKLNYIDDVVEAFTILATQLQVQPETIGNGQVFSLDTRRDYTLRQLAEIFENSLSVKLNIEWGALPYRNREVMKPAPYGKPIAGWTPKTEIRDGLKKTFAVEKIVLGN